MSQAQFSWDPVEVSPINTTYRTIRTAIPAPGSKEMLEKLAAYESRSMQGQMPLVWDKAEDYSVYDHAGNRWIDFTSTIFVTNVGHGNPSVINSVKKVLDKPLLHTYAYAHTRRAEYIEALVKFAGHAFEKAFLLSAGTEATEAALKLMRLYALKKNKRKSIIICISGNWHGRTQGAQSMSDNRKQKEWIGFDAPNIFHIPYPYDWVCDESQAEKFLQNSLAQLQSQGIDLRSDVCGFMLETFQGWCANFYPKSYVQAIERVCRDNDILLCFDEMQSGFARTGKKFGFEHYEVTPDLICVGKGMASGFPLSGVIGRKEIMDLPEVGNMSSTHSANPVCCAAGMATIQEIENRQLLCRSQELGQLLHQKLVELKNKYPDIISHVLGKGMIAALLFGDQQRSKVYCDLPTWICEQCFRRGLLLVHTGRESIKFGPPLTISKEALLEGLSVLDEVIAESLVEFNVREFA